MTRRAAFRMLAASVVACVAFGTAAQQDDNYAVVAGTVFREPGFALPGATVKLIPVPPQDSAGKRKKEKTQTATTNYQGEFAFRVPPGPSRYTLRVEARGVVPETREITVNALERVDVYLTMKPK